MVRSITVVLCALAAAVSVNGQLANRDSLVVIPARPTTADAITFDIVIPNWDCCTQYYFDSTAAAMGDTAILLSYSYELPQVCTMIACLDVAKVLPFRSGPLRAGVYAVWESRQLHCVGICPGVVFAPVKIGTVTVTQATAVAGRPSAVATRRATAANATTRVYNVAGEVLGQIGHDTPGARENLRPAGVYIVGSRAGAGMMVVR
jgi:hypothetical protein